MAGNRYKLIKFVTILKYCGILLNVLTTSKLSFFSISIKLWFASAQFSKQTKNLGLSKSKMIGNNVPAL
jgi:hypothetical protein